MTIINAKSTDRYLQLKSYGNADKAFVGLLRVTFYIRILYATHEQYQFDFSTPKFNIRYEKNTHPNKKMLIINALREHPIVKINVPPFAPTLISI